MSQPTNENIKVNAGSVYDVFRVTVGGFFVSFLTVFSKHLLNGQHCVTADEIIKCTPFHSQHHHLIAEVKFADLNGISEKKAGILQVI